METREQFRVLSDDGSGQGRSVPPQAAVHGIDERIGVRLELAKVDFVNRLNSAYREKVQLQEKTETNDVNLQRLIGYLEGLQHAQNIITDIVKEIREAEGEE